LGWPKLLNLRVISQKEVESAKMVNSLY